MPGTEATVCCTVYASCMQANQSLTALITDDRLTFHYKLGLLYQWLHFAGHFLGFPAGSHVVGVATVDGNGVRVK